MCDDSDDEYMHILTFDEMTDVVMSRIFPRYRKERAELRALNFPGFGKDATRLRYHALPCRCGNFPTLQWACCIDEWWMDCDNCKGPPENPNGMDGSWPSPSAAIKAHNEWVRGEEKL